MPVGIATSLIGTHSPRTVQIVVSGLTVGLAYTVTGSWSGGAWPVRAGTGAAEDTQLVLSDVAAPINTAVTYTVTHGGETATSAPLTVAYAYSAVLQTLSGDISVPLLLKDNQAPRALEVRQVAFPIPGRRRPVLRYDLASGETGDLLAATDGADTSTLKELLASGVPLLMRTNGLLVDFEAAAFLSFTAVSSSLFVGTQRRWKLAYQVIDDPEPDTLIGLPTWDDFDASYTGLTWDQFDAEWSGSTWEAFDVHDWATRAAT